jgi:hypothetical protein
LLRGGQPGDLALQRDEQIDLRGTIHSGWIDHGERPDNVRPRNRARGPLGNISGRTQGVEHRRQSLRSFEHVADFTL